MPSNGDIYTWGYFICELERYHKINNEYEFMLNVYDVNTVIGNNSFITVS